MRYDFSEAACFLNENAAPGELYDEVQEAMSNLMAPRLSRKKKRAMWHSLLTLADFLETITPKKKGGRHEEA